MIHYGEKFQSGLGYHDFLHVHGTEDQRRRWQGVHEQIALTDAQRTLLASFTREIKVICLAGAWCGDCVNQCPIFDHFQIVQPLIQVRYFDRDAHPDLGQALSVCGAARVPAVLFLTEDDCQLGMYGDRTLSKYRAMAAAQLGPSCPTGLVAEPRELQAAVVQDWLDEFERMHWIVRLSARLREKHGD
jgi:hypothetical protein